MIYRTTLTATEEQGILRFSVSGYRVLQIAHQFGPSYGAVQRVVQSGRVQDNGRRPFPRWVPSIRSTRLIIRAASSVLHTALMFQSRYAPLVSVK